MDGSASALRTSRDEAGAALLDQAAQARPKIVGGEAALDLPVERDRDLAGLFRHDHRRGVALLGQADRGAMPGAELTAEPRVHRQREEARGGGDAALLQDNRAVMQRGPWPEDGDQK